MQASPIFSSSIILHSVSQQERGQFPRVSKLRTTGISCALSWTLLRDARNVTISCALVHLSERAQLAHSAFSCWYMEAEEHFCVLY